MICTSAFVNKQKRFFSQEEVGYLNYKFSVSKTSGILVVKSMLAKQLSSCVGNSILLIELTKENPVHCVIESSLDKKTASLEGVHWKLNKALFTQKKVPNIFWNIFLPMCNAISCFKIIKISTILKSLHNFSAGFSMDFQHSWYFIKWASKISEVS